MSQYSSSVTNNFHSLHERNSRSSKLISCTGMPPRVAHNLFDVEWSCTNLVAQSRLQERKVRNERTRRKSEPPAENDAVTHKVIKSTLLAVLHAKQENECQNQTFWTASAPPQQTVD